MSCLRNITGLYVSRYKKRHSRKDNIKKARIMRAFFIAGLELVVQTHAEDVIGRDTVSMVEVG